MSRMRAMCASVLIRITLKYNCKNLHFAPSARPLLKPMVYPCSKSDFGSPKPFRGCNGHKGTSGSKLVPFACLYPVLYPCSKPSQKSLASARLTTESEMSKVRIKIFAFDFFPTTFSFLFKMLLQQAQLFAIRCKSIVIPLLFGVVHRLIPFPKQL